MAATEAAEGERPEPVLEEHRAIVTYRHIQDRWGLGSPDAARIKARRALAAAVDALREQYEYERERADRAEARAGQAEAERDAARVETAAERAWAAQAEREREEARVRAAAAEGEAKGLRDALAEARRPFWRRWLG